MRPVFPLFAGRRLLQVVALVPVAGVGLILCTMVWSSFLQGTPGTSQAVYSVRNFLTLLADPLMLSVGINTAIFALCTALVGLGTGTAIAWLVERTTFPGKQIVYTVMTLGLVIPTLFLAIGWVFLLNPRIGLINAWLRSIFGMASGPLNIATPVGMGWVEGLGLAPLAFIMTAETFRVMGASLEEAAEVHGLHRSAVTRWITLPLARPGLLAAFIYIFIIGFGAFDVPALIGLGNRVYTVSTYLFLKTNPPDATPQYGVAAAMGCMVLVFAVWLAAWYGSVLRRGARYQVVTGKGYRPRQIELGKWRPLAIGFVCAYVLLALVIPVLSVIWVSITPYLLVPSVQAVQQVSLGHFTSLSWDLIGRGLLHTLELMLAVPVVTLICSLPISWLIVRGRTRLRYLLDLAAFLPHTIPSIVFAVGAALLALFVVPRFVPIYGTVWLIGIVYVIVRMAFATRILNSCILQIHAELEEAAHVSGISILFTIRYVLMPLLLPAMASIGLWSALLSYRELTVATFLSTPQSVTLPVIVWSFWYAGYLGEAASVTLVLTGLMTPLILAYWVLTRRMATAVSPAMPASGDNIDSLGGAIVAA